MRNIVRGVMEGALFTVVFTSISSVVTGTYLPVYTETSAVTYNHTGESSRFPDQTSVEESDYKYFISDFNFETVRGKLLIGASDTLYMMNPDLTVDTALELPASQSDVDMCITSTRRDNPSFACHNHIRVYKKIPGQDTLLVCGTYAGVQPRCLGVGLSDGVLLVPVGDGEVASDGIISYFPEFSQFGDFRNDTNSDSVYLSAGFFNGDSGAGRHFSIAYKNIALTAPTDPDSLQTTELFRTINANNNWLRYPVTFVGSQKADYSPASSPTQMETDYQFWFLFLRENLVTDDIIYSRLARVCRNDPGSMSTSDGAHYFTTFMKARIFCERERPTSLDFTGSLDYVYNSITSFVFTDSSRYHSGGTYQKHLYGTFTAPMSGPIGSAICVYSAENTAETEGTGRSGSTFDIFREDLSTDSDGNNPVENDFIECAPEGRQGNDQQLLFIAGKSVSQLGDDPILVLDDVVVTQMVQDSACFVTRDNSSKCVNQDVLFLGLDSGHVLKVVFATDSVGEIEPVVAEDIQFDDSNGIVKMRLEEESGLLYVSTWSKIYSLPRHRCSRFNTCSECVGARDPYCVWSNEILECVQSPLRTSGSTERIVNDTLYFQNVHTGYSIGCNYPEVGFVEAGVSINESMMTLAISISASEAGFVEFYLQDGTATQGNDYRELSQVIEFTSESTIDVTITLVGDTVVEGDEWFLGSLRRFNNKGIILTMESINITIKDDDSVNISFSETNYSVSEGNSFITVTVNKVGETQLLTSVILQSSSGTAIAEEDYLAPDLVLNFDPTTDTQDIIIPLINDDIMEPNEVFSLSLMLTGEKENINIAMDTSFITISDDDVISISLSSSSVVLEASGSLSVQLVKSGLTVLPVTILLSTIDGTATAESDFIAVNSDVITFLANETLLSATVSIVDDTTVEDDETFYLTLATDTANRVRIENEETTITIRDMDTVIIRLASTAYTWSEGDGEVAVALEKIGSNEKDIAISLQVKPTTAEVGLDYLLAENYNIQFSPSDTHIDVSLFIIDDNELEDMETLFISLNNGPGAEYDMNSFANAVIIDDDYVTVDFDIESCALNIAESAGMAKITVAKIGLSSIPVDIMVSIQNGSATDPSDFSTSQLDSVVIIPSSVSTITLVIPIVDDEEVENEVEWFSVGIYTNQAGVTGNSTIDIMIIDDDNVSISLSESLLIVSEEVGVINITLTLYGSHSIPVSVSVYTVPASATESEDFVPTAETVTFDLGVSHGSLLVELINDDVRELTETFQVSVAVDDVVVVAGSITHTTVQIIDSDTVEIGFSSQYYSTSEGRGVVTLALEVRGLSSISIRVHVTTSDDTATAEEDYQPLVSELTLAPYDTSSRELTIIINDDKTREKTEVFIVQIALSSFNSVGVILMQNTSTIEIMDDDSVLVSFSAAGYTVSEGDGVVELTLLINGSTSYEFSLYLSTADKSAMVGMDYTELSSYQVDIHPSESLLSVAFDIVLDDPVVEGPEQFVITVETAAGDERVLLEQRDIEIFIISDDVVEIQFLEITSTLMEGERTDVMIISSSSAPFDITTTASIQTTSLQQQILSYIYFIKNPVTIPAGSTYTVLPIYIAPNLEGSTDNQLQVEILLELANRTEPNVELGPNSTQTVTIINVIKCTSIADPTTISFLTASLSPTPSCTPSITNDPPTIITGGVMADNSECFYSSEGVAMASTIVLSLLVIILCGTNTLTCLFLLHLQQYRKSSGKSDPSTCDLNPDPTKGVINLSNDSEHVFTNTGAESIDSPTVSDYKDATEEHGKELEGKDNAKKTTETSVL